MSREVLLDTRGLSAGWVLVAGQLGRRGRYLRSSIRLQRRSASAEEIPLPVLFDGRIREMIELPHDLAGLAWRPPDVGEYDGSPITLRRVGWIERTTRMAVRVLRTYLRLSEYERRECGLFLGKAFLDLRAAYRLCTGFLVRVRGQPYPDWIAQFDRLDDADRRAIRAHIERFAVRPRFHLLICGQSENPQAAGRTLRSLRVQLYANWSCSVLLHDESPGTDASSRAAGEDAAVQVVPRAELPEWLARFNASLQRERAAEWIMLLRAGDTLAEHALYWFAHEMQQEPEAPVFYSDDDIIDGDGRRLHPRFKPEWSPAYFHASHYIGAAAMMRGADVAAAGGVRAECCLHGNYDLLLRIIDAGRPPFAHLPAVLLHRSADLDAAGDWESPLACAEALQAHFSRNEIVAEITAAAAGGRRLHYRLSEPPPLVSILVPTRDAVALLKQCIDSVIAKTTYRPFEILVIDNQSRDREALAYLEKAATHPAVRVLPYDRPFNFSAINNYAVRQTRGEVLCLLNNDTEVISPDWLEEMVGHLLQPRVGAVGAKLYYPDGRVQHGGVTVGPGGGPNHLHLGLERDAAGYCGRAALAQELSAVTAACLVTWKHAYERLGGLNEKRLTVAFNDIDYCLRLQEAGYRVIFTPHAELYHHESASRGNDDPLPRRLRARGETKFMRRRWGERMRHDPYYNPNLSYRRPDFALGETARVRKPWRSDG
jgi:GT2 family glycosyltransferase